MRSGNETHVVAWCVVTVSSHVVAFSAYVLCQSYCGMCVRLFTNKMLVRVARA